MILYPLRHLSPKITQKERLSLKLHQKNLAKQRISISEKQNNKKGLTQNKESVLQIIHKIYSICPTWKTIFQSHPHG